MPEILRLTYRGGIADTAQMHFYEYSRASYAFARLLSTVEYFRRTGNVAQKINTLNYVDLTFSAPRAGSFITEVVVPTVMSTVPALQHVPVRAMMAYILQIVAPRTDATDETVIELAKIRLAELNRLVEQQKGLVTAHSELIATLRTIVETQTATTPQALQLVRYAMEATNAAVARLDIDIAGFNDMQRELVAEGEQQREVKEFEEYLGVLDTGSISRLHSRIIPMVSEIALPTRKDIKNFTISAAANENDEPIAYFTRPRVLNLASKTIEDTVTNQECRIKGFDRDLNVGRLNSPAFPRVLRFIMVPEKRHELQPKILRAMDTGVDTVICQFNRVLDRSKQPTSLILLDINSVT